jgi:hypothetical protein
MHVYVDGRKVSSQSFTPEAMKTVAEPLRVGAGTHGVIDEVRVYGKALAPEEVAELAK